MKKLPTKTKLPEDVRLFDNLSDLMEVDGYFIMSVAGYSGKSHKGKISLVSVADRRVRIEMDVRIIMPKG